MPVPVVATITAAPGSESVVHDALRELAVHTRGEEGCLSYELHRSTADAAVFVTIESWRDPSDLDAHLQTPHVVEALRVTDGHLAAPPAIHPLQPAED